MPTITYQQDEWNKYNSYAQLDKKHIIEFWRIYNQHLLEIVSRMNAESLGKKCNTEMPGLTVEFLFIDYVKHLEHHLRQILKYE